VAVAHVGVVGEPAGFREFVEAQSRQLLRAAWLLTGDWGMAEDLVQTAMIVTWSHWSALTRPDAPQLYVQRVMLTTFLRWRRRQWSGEISTPLPEQGSALGVTDEVDLRHSVAVALAVLPSRQRAVVVLRYFLDLTEAQTAELLGCSVGSVKSQASRALSRLRRSPGLAEIMTGGVAS
jgi:RNA polymerase sigma-70 factor (sigma-E family)